VDVKFQYDFFEYDVQWLLPNYVFTAARSEIYTQRFVVSTKQCVRGGSRDMNRVITYNLYFIRISFQISFV